VRRPKGTLGAFGRENTLPFGSDNQPDARYRRQYETQHNGGNKGLGTLQRHVILGFNTSHHFFLPVVGERDWITATR
jgi:hypothetical protein